MKLMSQTNVQKLNTILAGAKKNRLEPRRFDPSAMTPADEERLKAESITQAQVELLDRLQVIYDARPLAAGGTCSRWAAMRQIDGALSAAWSAEADRTNRVPDRRKPRDLRGGPGTRAP